MLSPAAHPDERYTIISADCHAGLKCEDYRAYLDPQYFSQFDEFLAERSTYTTDGNSDRDGSLRR